MEHDGKENKWSHRVCELCARLIIGDREWAGRATQGTGGHLGGLSFSGLVEQLPCGLMTPSSSSWPFKDCLQELCHRSHLAGFPPFPGLPSLPSTQQTQRASLQGSVCGIKFRAAVFSQGFWSFTTLWMLPQKAQSKSLSSKILLCK